MVDLPTQMVDLPTQMVDFPTPISKMSSSQSCSHRNSVQNGPIEKFTALTGTIFVNMKTPAADHRRTPIALCHALWGMIGRKFRRELHLMIDFVENLSLILTPTGSQNQPQEGPKSWILGCWRGPGARLPLKLSKKAKRSN